MSPATAADAPLVIARIRTAVDWITQPQRVRIMRDLDPPSWLTEGTREWHAATDTHGTIPSLWEQSETALYTGTEQTDGRSRTQAERAPCDLDLMEIRGLIRDTTDMELRRLGQPRTGHTPELLRRLAVTVISREPAELWWWEYRFTSWGRLLASYLQAVNAAPKPIRLRNAPCPVCRTRSITVESDQGPVLVPVLLIDFTDGYVRAASCQACGYAWFRGRGMLDLADALNGVMVANSA